jgi:DNA-directed RNA polymerase delta subunit
MKALSVQESTYKRLDSLVKELMHDRNRDLNYDDVINELIDSYQETNWSHFGAGAGGG